MFLSCCLVIKQIHENPDSKVHLPIFLDASCSGIQHLTALLRDPPRTGIASKVNLASKDISEKPDDFYSSMLPLINKKNKSNWFRRK